jgi:hypothetical protein
MGHRRALDDPRILGGTPDQRELLIIEQRQIGILREIDAGFGRLRFTDEIRACAYWT